MPDIASSHVRWVYGWEQQPFSFAAVFSDLYDFDATDALLYDDFDPAQRVATSAAEYGSFWDPVFGDMLAIHHDIASPPQVLETPALAVSTLTFTAHIETRTAATNIRTTSTLTWHPTPAGWRIIREHNSTKVLP
jgi:ketosteroid isomerase-like protein